jgi:hypothetical protein
VQAQSHGTEHRHADESYLAARIREALATDSRTASNQLKVVVADQRIVVRGEALSRTVCDSVTEVVEEIAPGYELDNQVKSSDMPPPQSAEEIV